MSSDWSDLSLGEQETERAMERAGVVEVRRKLVGHVSRGYRQRTGLADALVANPPILVLDEPTSGLDPNQRRRVKQLVKDLAQDHTILFSSHILAEVHDVSSRILVIHRGKLRADGTPAQLLAASDRRLHVEVRGAKEALTASLRGVPGLQLRDAVADGDYAVIAADVARDHDPRDAVGLALAKAGLTIRELRLAAPTLEEFFYTITEGADRKEELAAAAAAGSAVASRRPSGSRSTHAGSSPSCTSSRGCLHPRATTPRSPISSSPSCSSRSS